MRKLLEDVKVLELTHTLAGSYCAKLLADQGADTIKIEPPGQGDTARYEPPFLGGIPNQERSTLFLAFNTNKKGITLDITSPEGRKLFLDLVKESDIIIESFPPGHLDRYELGYDELQKINPRLILTSVTYYGQTGPYKSFKADDLTAQAMGGYLFAVTGLADKPPMGTALYQMDITAARNGATATLAALFQQRDSNLGQHVDVSEIEAAISTPGGLIQQYSFVGAVQRRGGGERNVLDGMHLNTKDGEVTLTTAGTGGRPMETWAEFLGEPRLTDPKFSSRQGRSQNWGELHKLVQDKLLEWNNLDLMEAATAKGLVIGLVQNISQVINSPHLEGRQCFAELNHREVGPLMYPGPGFLLDGENPMRGTSAAPLLGEHNDSIFCDRLNVSKDKLEQLKAMGVV